jgi:nitrate/nitrite transporter NarK
MGDRLIEPRRIGPPRHHARVGGLFVPLVVMEALVGRLAGTAVGDTHTTLFVVIGVAALVTGASSVSAYQRTSRWYRPDAGSDGDSATAPDARDP